MQRTKNRLPLSPEEIEQFKTLAVYLTVEQLADHFGVTASTMRNWLQEYPTLGRIYRKAKTETIAKVGQTLVQMALQKNLGAICFFLKAQAGWRETVRQEIVGKDGGPIKTVNENVNVENAKIDLSDFTIEELKALEKLGLKMKEDTGTGKEEESNIDGETLH